MISQETSTIHAYAAREACGALASFDYEAGALGPHEVEIEITHCGICHSDLHLIDNDWLTSKYPLVPGHEVVGTVARKGAQVTHLDLGRSGRCRLAMRELPSVRVV